MRVSIDASLRVHDGPILPVLLEYINYILHKLRRHAIFLAASISQLHTFPKEGRNVNAKALCEHI